jgi:hypothetical protein
MKLPSKVTPTRQINIETNCIKVKQLLLLGSRGVRLKTINSFVEIAGSSIL